MPAQTNTSPAASPHPKLDAVAIAMRPAWTSRYGHDAAPQLPRLNISKTMQIYGLDRSAAVEVQNHLYDRVRDKAVKPASYDEALQYAVETVKQGTYEDERRSEQLRDAKFIIVFDLDATLLDQYMSPDVGARCHDFVGSEPDGRARHVKLVPGWQRAFRTIRKLGGAIVIFTANTDVRSWQNANLWEFDGVPLARNPNIAGFLTNSHLIQQETFEGKGSEDPRRGNPIQEPSKDLRIVDPGLRKSIIVDDNPSRLFQFRNTRVFKKFHAQQLCLAKDDAVRKAHATAMDRVVYEIEDSVAYMNANPGTDFVGAYLPYTALGLVARQWAQDTLGLTRPQAVAWVRSHPEQVDLRY